MPIKFVLNETSYFGENARTNLAFLYINYSSYKSTNTFEKYCFPVAVVFASSIVHVPRNTGNSSVFLYSITFIAGI